MGRGTTAQRLSRKGVPCRPWTRGGAAVVSEERTGIFPVPSRFTSSRLEVFVSLVTKCSGDTNVHVLRELGDETVDTTSDTVMI